MITYIRRQQHKNIKHQDIKQNKKKKTKKKKQKKKKKKKKTPQKYRFGTISNKKLLAGLNRFGTDRDCCVFFFG